MPRSLLVVLSALALVTGCQEYDLAGQPDDVELPPEAPPVVPPVVETPTETPPAPTEEEPVDPPAPPDPVDPPTPDPADDYAEAWTLPTDAPVDIVVFGDTSGSMSDELEELGDNMAVFTNRLVTDGVDWRLMAVNGDEGCGVGGWYDASIPTWQTDFTDSLLVEPDDYDEAGLITAAMAVEASAPGGCNAGFLRPDALLHIVFISDETDQSPGHNQAGYWQQYVDRVVAAKGDAAMVTMSAVAGPTPNGCADADAGYGYSEAVSATSGAFLSICDGWATDLGTLAGAAVIQDTFTLADVADPTTIDVFVNGSESPNSDWIFDAGSNTVRFVQNPPEPGDSVEITYSGA